MFNAIKYLNKNTISLKKVINRFKVISEYANEKDHLASFPNMIHIEPTNHCNLGCVMCPQPTEMQRVKGMMSLELYKSMIDELQNTPAEFIYLHQFGESLLHKKITDMVDYASEKGLQVGMSTNGTLCKTWLAKNSSKL